MNKVLLDGNIYDKLELDLESRSVLGALISRSFVRVIATPIVVDELSNSHFGGLPGWFPIEVEAESVTVLGYAHLSMTRLGEGEVYSEHRGASKKIPDAIIADSANSLADILVSEDSRCRERLKRISNHCKAMDYSEFCSWLRDATEGTS